MSKGKTEPSPLKWMLMSQTEVLDSFANVPNAFSDGEGQHRFVFIPGTRKDRVLLVAHSDTVFKDTPPKIGFFNDIFYSKNVVKKEKKKRSFFYGTGIGADDRAGCAILWELRRTGHSILVTSGEEQGCIGSNYIMNSDYWSKLFNYDHNFAVEFDRKGRNDLVFYQVGSPKFRKYVEKQTGYETAHGSFTDICVLCRKICAVNISVGYYNEHSVEEKLVYSQWLRTLSTAYKWLSQDNLPRFEQEDDVIEYPVSNYNDCFRRLPISQMHSKNPSYENALRHEGIYATQIVQCNFCNTKMESQDWVKNKFCCLKCNSMNCRIL